MENKEKKLFDLLESVGETLEGKVHIIRSTSDEYPLIAASRGKVERDVFDSEKYRVYHSDGYCFDAEKVLEDGEDESNLKFDYSFSSEWDGFKKLTIDDALLLIDRAFHRKLIKKAIS